MNTWTAIGFANGTKMVGKIHDLKKNYAIQNLNIHLKINNSVIMCKLSQYPAVETYYNFNHYSQVLYNSNRTIGLWNQTITQNNNKFFACSARRFISIDSIPDKFFDLSNLYYLLVAKGPLKGNLFKLKQFVISYYLNHEYFF